MLLESTAVTTPPACSERKSSMTSNCANGIVGLTLNKNPMTTESKHLWDCVAVNLKTNKVRILERNKTLENAEVFNRIAVCRRGVDEEFFVKTVAGKFNDGDVYAS